MNLAGFRICSEVEINDGRLEEFKETLSELMVELERTELRTRQYIAYISEDGRRCQFDQWYEDEDAFMDHLEGAGREIDRRISPLTTFFRSWIYTEPRGQRVRDLIDSYGRPDKMIFGPPFSGYTR